MKDQSLFAIPHKIAQELNLSLSSVESVIRLLEEGNTIPFISRYRKEATGNLDEVSVKAIQERNVYLKELEERRLFILTSIESQGKLEEALKEQILNCTSKVSLEDLYLPYKPKRRTRGMIAREKGLDTLAQLILSQPLGVHPSKEAEKWIDLEAGAKTTEEALAGARDIIAENVAEHKEARDFIRHLFAKEGMIISKVRLDKTEEMSKFELYYDFKELVKNIPSHRYLAIRRGEREDVLDVRIEIDLEKASQNLFLLFKVNPLSPFRTELEKAIEDSLRRLLCPSVETDVRLDLKQASDKEAVAVFADNLRHLLLASPLGGQTVIGIDPGIRTGCKCAVVDLTGKFLESTTIYLSQGEKALESAKLQLAQWIKKYKPYAIAVGNGTAGRETESFTKQLLKELGESSVFVVSVNEAGASVYSASDVAREEFPDLDLTVRGAISIARRLQDPLAELVKVDPKSIGVGQYQHDVHQPLLQEELHHVVESCVNKVGVNLNTASAFLLSYVSGIGPNLSRKIVKFREEVGPFKNRKELRKITGFGAKTFEQAAGFLRIPEGENPLDASAVHPERYEILEKIAADLEISIKDLMQQPQLVERIEKRKYMDVVGEFTFLDILEELKRPGRDPRSSFEPPIFRDDLMSIKDLKEGMKLEGIVTNVTAFGAFVDIGVHQDGLVHLSELSENFIKHPKEVVKTGDKIKVEVLQVDVLRNKIGLTARSNKKQKIHPPKTPPVKTNRFESNPFAGL